MTRRRGFMPFFSSLDNDRIHELAEQRQADEDRRQRLAREFEEFKEAVDRLPELVLSLDIGEAHFVCIYEPMKPFTKEAPYRFGLTVPFSRICEASAPVAEVLLSEGRVNKPRIGGLDFDYVNIYGKSRPEVYTIHPGRANNHWEDLDVLSKELERLKARNLAPDHFFKTRPLRIYAKPYAYWAGPDRGMRRGVTLTPTKIGVLL